MAYDEATYVVNKLKGAGLTSAQNTRLTNIETAVNAIKKEVVPNYGIEKPMKKLRYRFIGASSVTSTATILLPSGYKHLKFSLGTGTSATIDGTSASANTEITLDPTKPHTLKFTSSLSAYTGGGTSIATLYDLSGDVISYGTNGSTNVALAELYGATFYDGSPSANLYIEAILAGLTLVTSNFSNIIDGTSITIDDYNNANYAAISTSVYGGTNRLIVK